MVEWQNGTTPNELKSEAMILAASQKGDVKVVPSELVVKCPFVQWERASSNIGDAGYSPMWRIIATTWADAGHAEFLTSAKELSSHVTSGDLSVKVAGVVVNCPFVEAGAAYTDPPLFLF